MLLITGSKGQLGTCMSRAIPDAICTDIDELDITSATAVSDFVRLNKIDAIINCAAYTAVDRAEDDIEAARRINVDAVRNLAMSGAYVIHISTDYVFDGGKNRPYVETDDALPCSVYGITKLGGERALFETTDKACVFRVSWLYSPYGNNFVKTMRRLGAERRSIGVVFDQVGSPTCALDLADFIASNFNSITDLRRGLFHFSGEGVCSWYDFARKIMEFSGIGCRILPIESADYPQKAARPFYSVMNKSKIKAGFGIEVPHWEESLGKCLKQF